MFSEIYPEEEFLPRAPDPDEIIIEGDNPTDASDSLFEADDDSDAIKTTPEAIIDEKSHTDVNHTTEDNQNTE